MLSEDERNAGIHTTRQYYAREARAYSQRTSTIDLRALYAPFLGMLPASGHILDAGCGAGRDCLYFLQRGYRVTAFDASIELASIAAEVTGLPVSCQRFQDFEDINTYDGIWACASLLHVPRVEMSDVLARLSRSLKRGGVICASFRYGNGETIREERFFNDYDEVELKNLLQPFEELELVHAWQSEDLSLHRPEVKWLNALIEKTRHPVG